MTAAAANTPADPADPGGRLERYIAHRASGALLVTGMTVVVNDFVRLVNGPSLTDLLGVTATLAFLIVLGFTIAHRARLWRGKALCGGCSEKIPDDINATIARHDRQLRYTHLQDTKRYIVTGLVLLATYAAAWITNAVTDYAWADTASKAMSSLVFAGVLLEG